MRCARYSIVRVSAERIRPPARPPVERLLRCWTSRGREALRRLAWLGVVCVHLVHHLPCCILYATCRVASRTPPVLSCCSVARAQGLPRWLARFGALGSQVRLRTPVPPPPPIPMQYVACHVPCCMLHALCHVADGWASSCRPRRRVVLRIMLCRIGCRRRHCAHPHAAAHSACCIAAGTKATR